MAQIVAGTVNRSIVVDAPIERAFTTFTERFGDFKPPEHNLLTAPLAETVFEPRVGGNIVDRAVDGSECRWARILAYEPPERVVFSWDISPRWQLETDPDNTSEVEVHFLPRGPGGPGSSSSTASSTGTGRARRPSSTASTGTRAGRCTWPATPPCSSRPDRCRTRPRAGRRTLLMRRSRGARRVRAIRSRSGPHPMTRSSTWRSMTLTSTRQEPTPARVPRMAARTPAVTTVAPMVARTAVPTVEPMAALTVGPMAAPMVVRTAVPMVAPMVARTAGPRVRRTAAPTRAVTTAGPTGRPDRSRADRQLTVSWPADE